jgi:hypothetical protein
MQPTEKPIVGAQVAMINFVLSLTLEKFKHFFFL